MKLKNIFLCGLTALALTGCNLDEFPKDSVSPETFFKTEKELKLYSNQFYTTLPDASDFYMESSDYIVHNLSYSDAVRGYAHVVPSTGGGWSFSTLRHINYFLQNLYRCEDELCEKSMKVWDASGVPTSTSQSCNSLATCLGTIRC